MTPAPNFKMDERRVKAKLSRSDAPYVTLKAAISLDGKIATRGGDSQWITGPAAREFAHHVRAAHEGIIAGAKTVAADDPQLNVRVKGRNAKPARIILDSRCGTPPTARCFADDGARRIVVAGNAAPEAKVRALEAVGVEVIQGTAERPRPTEFLPLLRKGGLNTLLVEGGGEVHANFIANRVPDELLLFMAGMVIGGDDALGWCASLGIDRLHQAPRLELTAPIHLGGDLMLRCFFGDFPDEGPRKS